MNLPVAQLEAMMSRGFLKDSRDFGQYVRRRRKEAGLRQTDLAEAAGVSYRYVLELEAGKETAQIGKALRILDVLGTRLIAVPGDADGRAGESGARAEAVAGGAAGEEEPAAGTVLRGMSEPAGAPFEGFPTGGALPKDNPKAGHRPLPARRAGAAPARDDDDDLEVEAE